MEEVTYVIIGIVIGWVTKIPFVLKWYKELKSTRTYEYMQDKVRHKEMVDKYNKMFPNNKICQKN